MLFLEPERSIPLEEFIEIEQYWDFNKIENKKIAYKVILQLRDTFQKLKYKNYILDFRDLMFLGSFLEKIPTLLQLVTFNVIIEEFGYGEFRRFSNVLDIIYWFRANGIDKARLGVEMNQRDCYKWLTSDNEFYIPYLIQENYI